MAQQGTLEEDGEIKPKSNNQILLTVLVFQHMVKYPQYLPTDTRDANFDKGSIKLDLKDVDLKRLSFEIERERYQYAYGVNK